mgnify:CR=1 FL=1
MLHVEELSLFYRSEGLIVPVLDRFSLHLPAGRTIALVGDSGSGKTSLALAILGLLPDNAVLQGRITLSGLELTSLSERQRRLLRVQRIRYLSQHPSVLFNPVRTIGDHLCESLQHAFPRQQRSSLIQQARAWLCEVGLEPSHLHSYPHQFSGGMLQRAALALAISAKPELLIADEPTSSLDSLHAVQILTLMQQLQKRHNTSILWITHHSGLAHHFSDQIVRLPSR